jgi:RNA polymerase sigma-70 factor (ECF subfamily)
MTSDENDWPLVACGDHDAFARVFDRHADLVFKFARRRVGDVGVAEDITSQVFLETWRRRGEVNLLDGSLRAWLLGIARNLQRRHWRSTERKTRAIDRLSPTTVEVDTCDAVADRLDAVDELALVRRRLDCLSDNHREVLLLAVWEELSYDEIAAVLNVPIGTVRSRLARARQNLESDGTGQSDRASSDSSSTRSDHDPNGPHFERTPG